MRTWANHRGWKTWEGYAKKTKCWKGRKPNKGPKLGWQYVGNSGEISERHIINK